MVSAVWSGDSFKVKTMVQIYGIDLASEKFDVSFINEDGKACHKIIKNDIGHIERFVTSLPTDAWLVAEYTGVYGDMLLFVARQHGIRITYVPGYEIKHSSGLTKGKSDKADAAMIRDYGERHVDKLELTEFPSEALYKLRELYATRRMLVQQRKQLQTMQKGDEKRPLHCDKAVMIKSRMVDEIDDAISEIESEMQAIVDDDENLRKSSTIAQSIPGIGKVTSIELIIKTDNFQRVSTAKKCASLAGIAPFPNATGKTDKGNHVSKFGDKQLKSLLYMCAQVAVRYFEKMRVYKMKKYDVEHKPYFVVMNNVANRLLKILYALIKAGETYNPLYIPRDPRLRLAN